jgi:hypothetical protein
MTDNRKYIIIANDCNHRIWAYGSPTNNRPFTSEQAAERRKRKMERLIPGRDFLVVPLSEVNLEVRSDG